MLSEIWHAANMHNKLPEGMGIHAVDHIFLLWAIYASSIIPSVGMKPLKSRGNGC
jgi:hypothetical protein